MNEIAHLYFIFFYSHFRSLLETITLCLVSSKNGQGINRFWCELRVLASIFCQFWFALDSRGWNGFLQNLAFDLCDQIAWGCLWLDDISTHKHDDNWTRKRAELNTNNTCLRCKSSFLFLTEINFFFYSFDVKFSEDLPFLFRGRILRWRSILSLVVLGDVTWNFLFLPFFRQRPAELPKNRNTGFVIEPIIESTETYLCVETTSVCDECRWCIVCRSLNAIIHNAAYMFLALRVSFRSQLHKQMTRACAYQNRRIYRDTVVRKWNTNEQTSAYIDTSSTSVLQRIIFCIFKTKSTRRSRQFSLNIRKVNRRFRQTLSREFFSLNRTN